MKNFKLYIIAIIMILPLSLEAGIYGTLTGKVLDQDGKPVIGATVLVLGTNNGTYVKDKEGKFTIVKIKSGTYTVKARAVGFEEEKIENVLIKADSTISIFFTLNATNIQMESIVISADKTMVRKDDIGCSRSYSAEYGNALGGIVNTSNLSAVARESVSSIVGLSAGTSTSGHGYNIRGARSAETQIRVDGLDVGNQFTGGFGSGGSGYFPGISCFATEEVISYSNPFLAEYGDAPWDKPNNAIQVLNKPYYNRKIKVNSNQERFNTEHYDPIVENEFMDAKENPLSTFSIDVDAASYSNARRFINNGILPPPGAVRTEEFINYFNYDYPQPEGDHPFSITTEMSDCPWADGQKLLLIGLQGYEVPTEDLPPSNLVFLIDVSGSMYPSNKLPLVKSSLNLLIDKLSENDRVAIVVYAGAAGLVLPSTSCKEKQKIKDALNMLGAGGSTAGGAGIKLAYKTGKKNFIENGNNRVILCTDGDFNVGVSSDDELVKLIEEKRNEGMFLTVLGFGMGNYKDSKMEKLADKGNGNYAYIDNIKEAIKVLVSESGGTLFTIAKDVKIQIEFNPSKVIAYRLIGYENRILAKEDFDDDTKDAGELGSGHSVTAIYQIVPKGIESPARKTSELIYQQSILTDKATQSNEIMTVKFRYKNPDEDESKLIVNTLYENPLFVNPSNNMLFATSVASYCMLLRNSAFKGDLNYDKVLEMASQSKGHDPDGYRSELISLIKTSKELSAKIAENK